MLLGFRIDNSHDKYTLPKYWNSKESYFNKVVYIKRIQSTQEDAD